jgi:hypothetical protein
MMRSPAGEFQNAAMLDTRSGFPRLSGKEPYFLCDAFPMRPRADGKETLLWSQPNCACDLKSNEPSYEWRTHGQGEADS